MVLKWRLELETPPGSEEVPGPGVLPGPEGAPGPRVLPGPEGVPGPRVLAGSEVVRGPEPRPRRASRPRR